MSGSNIPDLTHYRIDMAGTVVRIDQAAMDRLLNAKAMHGDTLCTVTDLFGSPTKIALQHVEAISYITPESAALAREWGRAFNAQMDVHDPEGKEEERSW